MLSYSTANSGILRFRHWRTVFMVPLIRAASATITARERRMTVPLRWNAFSLDQVAPSSNSLTTSARSQFHTPLISALIFH
jgi:hypothetical protein